MWRGLGGWRFVVYCVVLGATLAALSFALFPDDATARRVMRWIACGGCGFAWARWYEQQERDQ